MLTRFSSGLLLSIILLALPMVAFAQTTEIDPALAAAAASAALVSLVCGVIGFVINILIIVWVYRDAQKHGANGALWAIIVFFTSLIGLLLYLVIGRKSGTGSVAR